ncbi:MAG: hypothetical protein WD066_15380 [Planctomycetaceae bacterium]
MTTLLQRALARIESLPPADQDAIASRLLAEVEDEDQWNARFAATTEGQWERLAEKVRIEVAADGTRPLEDSFPSDERSR